MKAHLTPALRRFLAAVVASTALVSSVASGAPFAYVAQSEADQLAVVDLATLTIVATVRTADNPLGVAVSGTKAYLTSPFANIISILDRSTNALSTVSATPGPFGVAVNAAGTRIAVSLTGSATPNNSIALFDAGSNAPIGTATVGSGPTGIVFSPAGDRIYVANSAGHSISVLNAATLATITTISVLEGPVGLALNSAGTRLYVSHVGTATVDGNRVSVINTSNNTVIATVPVGVNPVGIAVNPSGSRVFVTSADSGSVTVIDTGSNAVAGTIATGGTPVSVAVTPDGSRVVVLDPESNQLALYDATSLARVGGMAISGGPVAFGNFIAAQSSTSAVNSPGARSGLFWNPSENGWGLSITQRGNVAFAAWYTYDGAGRPKWYVASECRFSGNTCTGALYETAGPRFFGAAFNPAAVGVSAVGSLTLAFSGNDDASMSYVVNGQSRTVPITRQLFGSGSAPPTNFTDLWWNPNESGWGAAITHRAHTIFVAWFVYDANGNPVWYVASNCVMNLQQNGCTGDVYRTTAAPFGPVFQAASVQVFNAGTMTLSFGDGNNGTLTYVVDGVSGSKAITRQLF